MKSSKAPADEIELSIPPNEEWQRDGGAMTGLDKALPLAIRANITGSRLTKI